MDCGSCLVCCCMCVARLRGGFLAVRLVILRGGLVCCGFGGGLVGFRVFIDLGWVLIW